MSLSAKEIAQIQAELHSAKRELQIEASVERVRAKALVMHRSEEMANVAITMRNELQNLGVEGVSSSTVYTEQGDGAYRIWDMAEIQDVDDSEIHLDLVFHPDEAKGDLYFNDIKNADGFSTFHYHDERLKAIATWLSEYDPVSADQMKGLIERGDLSDLWISSYPVDRGFLSVDTVLEPSEELGSILPKMAAAFNLAYRRFEDLLHAEAQTRKAQIEAALERVRSRTMAMRESSELAPIVGVIFKELTSLDLELSRAIIWTFEEEAEIIHWWMANPEAEASVSSYRMPYNDLPLTQHFLQAWRDQVGDSVYEHEGRLKREYDDYIFGETEVGQLPQEAQEGMRAPDAVYLSSSIGTFGTVMAASESSISDDNHQIIQRFGKIFQQAYTRFLDVQLAEEQAHEARIEAVLERVRGQAMAMRTSNDVREVIRMTYSELKQLNESLFFVSYYTYDPETQEMTSWPEVPGQETLRPFSLPRIDHPFHDRYIDAFENQIPFYSCRLEYESKAAYDAVLFTESDYKNVPDGMRQKMLDMKSIVSCNAVYRNSLLQTATTEDLGPGGPALLERFVPMFDLTYTRFLDLQKAEEQAREAQIEAALERVRSRAMAMNSSEELIDVSLELRQQMGLLGQKDLEVCAIHLYEVNDEMFESWGAMHSPGHEGEIMTEQSLFPKVGYDVIEETLAKYHSEETEYVIVNEGQKAVGFLNMLREYAPEVYEIIGKSMESAGAPPKAYWSMADFSGGSLLMVTYEPAADDSRDLLLRCANVFDLAYRRFRDLKESEEAAREAQIEVALERVRSRTMAMRQSTELEQVALVYSDQLEELGLDISGAMFLLQDPDKEVWTLWTAYSRSYPIKRLRGKTFEFPFPEVEGDPTIEAWRRGETVTESFVSPDELTQWAATYKTVLDVSGQTPDDLIRIYPAGYFRIDSSMKYGLFAGGGYRQFTQEEIQIQTRLAKEFDRTYQRLLELKKAEEAAREAQIEAAMERVRSRTMAMQASHELLEVSTVMTEQLVDLGIDIHWAYLYLYNEEQDELEMYLTKSSNHPVEIAKGGFGLWKYPRSYHDSGEGQSEFLKAWQNRDAFRESNWDRDHFDDWADQFQMMFDDLGYTREDYRPFVPDGVFNLDALMGPGYIGMGGAMPFAKEDIDILVRFAGEFEGTYRRFLDIQKAEAQTREAQIEAALERVRGRAMAMQKPSDLGQVSVLMFDELAGLGVESLRSGISIPADGDRYDFHAAAKSEDGSTTMVLGNESIDVHPIIRKAYDGWKNQEVFQHSVLEGDDLLEYYHAVFDTMPLPDWKERMKTGAAAKEGFATFPFSEGWLYTYSHEEVGEEAAGIFVRFSKVFGLAYQRYHDLMTSEAQAREAQIEAALERVRGRAMSMTTSNELLDVVMIIHQEFAGLDLDCGVFWHAKYTSDGYEKALTGVGGTRVTTIMELPRDFSMVPELATWERGSEELGVFKFDADAAVRYLNHMIEKGNFLEVDPNAITEDAVRENHGWTFVQARTSHGEIGYTLWGETEPSEEATEVLLRLAGAFDLAYTRFEDIQKAEGDLVRLKEEKARTETALAELQSTQKQLVEQEKLASLGSLTAGIAHEIKNPLNFVNNFAEVSVEMAEELKEAAEAGDTDEIVSLVQELMDNATQIAKHGKRADSIVKSMMQHARGGASDREEIKLNEFLEEYINLAWHGMRAKDHSFQGDVNRDFDPAVGVIEGQPQELGRVILNLLNNAFDVIKKQSDGVVIVRTAKRDNEIEISVSDNGSGIPDDIRDKIFEPFFTTKATGEGTGLGLSLSYDIITKGHGGTMTVGSSKDGGADFIIKLPGGDA